MNLKCILHVFPELGKANNEIYLLFPICEILSRNGIVCRLIM